jgi:hypothetical protein
MKAFICRNMNRAEGIADLAKVAMGSKAGCNANWQLGCEECHARFKSEKWWSDQEAFKADHFVDVSEEVEAILKRRS